MSTSRLPHAEHSSRSRRFGTIAVAGVVGQSIDACRRDMIEEPSGKSSPSLLPDAQARRRAARAGRRDDRPGAGGPPPEPRGEAMTSPGVH